MKNAAQTRILAIALALATVAACVLAAMNFEHENGLDVPTDGIWWVEAHGGLRAEQVPPDSPGQRAGVRAGDVLVSINERPTTRVASFVREMFHSGIWAHATYSILRPLPHAIDLNGAARLDIQVILEPTDRSINQSAIYCAGVPLHRDLCPVPAMDRTEIDPLLRLLSGLVCAVSFRHDRTNLTRIYWGNIVAQALQPALFLHFAVSFSDNYASDSATASTAADLRAALSAGNLSARSAVRGDSLLVGDRGAASSPGPDRAWAILRSTTSSPQSSSSPIPQG